MGESYNFRFSNSVLIAPMLAILLIWTVFWAEVRFGVNFNDFGVYPRTIKGLRGVLFSPFIHGSVEHLYNNTIPLILLLAALFYFYRRNAMVVLLVGFFLSGSLTWLIGRPSYHIGASGIIYVLASFIFFKGVIAKHYRLIALSLAVVFIYGGMLWYIFPIEDGISWEGHLSGFLAGLFLALVLKSDFPKEKKFTWQREDYNEEEDEFMKHFDEEGNFIENMGGADDEGISIKYHYRKGKD
ncbi:rhomboid family intramembrane serine protease [Allomuricauda sp. SCSIO 65647]|uniref:rhomboid family intramembrane serine protease n=1 Tax=Allomuricauda sp. SCSIO 65647 TaxID=2908843 RepID=UPI001F2E813E|nr:rhomboid family intramembrane serine protease [Muricauda sp. SCSIO 65647]UJH66548.1 rhomboid family intramembrane serine protease [Muricauda sp. SCSIO 65647]